MLSQLARWLRNSRHAHIRQANISTAAELVSLIDRFADRRLQYPLEWDDFVSWKNRHPDIEEIRLRIASTELNFRSGDAKERQKGIAIILHERNRLASAVGLAPRESWP